MSSEITRSGVERPASRADLARQLLARVDRLEARLGDVSLAAEIQLLKRGLARGHAGLSDRPEDNNYLSVVCLVEAALASLTWKQYTPEVLAALHRAFAAGTREGPSRSRSTTRSGGTSASRISPPAPPSTSARRTSKRARMVRKRSLNCPCPRCPLPRPPAGTGSARGGRPPPGRAAVPCGCRRAGRSPRPSRPAGCGPACPG